MQADLCGPKEACIRWGVHHFPNTTDDLCSSDNVFFSYHYCSSFFLLKMHCESQTEMHYHRIPTECFFFCFFVTFQIRLLNSQYLAQITEQLIDSNCSVWVSGL